MWIRLCISPPLHGFLFLFIFFLICFISNVNLRLTYSRTFWTPQQIRPWYKCSRSDLIFLSSNSIRIYKMPFISFLSGARRFTATQRLLSWTYQWRIQVWKKPEEFRRKYTAPLKIFQIGNYNFIRQLNALSINLYLRLKASLIAN